MQLAEHERSIDKQTGLPIEVAFTEQPFLVDFAVNHAERAIELERATHAEANKDNPGWSAGRRYYAQPVDPAEHPGLPRRTAPGRSPDAPTPD